MTDIEAIRIAEQEIDRISDLLGRCPQIYDNPGMKKNIRKKPRMACAITGDSKKKN